MHKMCDDPVDIGEPASSSHVPVAKAEAKARVKAKARACAEKPSPLTLRLLRETSGLRRSHLSI